jgi:mannose PTS system EIIA component
MIGILVISHEPLGTALISCTRHIFGRLPPQLAALDVIPDEDTTEASAAARQLQACINDGSGVLVLTDIYGATPSRIAAKLADPFRCVVIAGANLPMLVKAINYRKGRDLEEIADLIMPAGKEAIMPITEST